MGKDHKPVQTMPMPTTQSHPIEPQPTPQAMKQEETSWPMDAVIKGEAQSSMSAFVTWTHAPRGTPH